MTEPERSKAGVLVTGAMSDMVVSRSIFVAAAHSVLGIVRHADEAFTALRGLDGVRPDLPGGFERRPAA